MIFAIYTDVKKHEEQLMKLSITYLDYNNITFKEGQRLNLTNIFKNKTIDFDDDAVINRETVAQALKKTLYESYLKTSKYKNKNLNQFNKYVIAWSLCTSAAHDDVDISNVEIPCF